MLRSVHFVALVVALMPTVNLISAAVGVLCLHSLHVCLICIYMNFKYKCTYTCVVYCWLPTLNVRLLQYFAIQTLTAIFFKN